eukprot:609214-Amorphochlora_amoeboformis.AAC.1
MQSLTQPKFNPSINPDHNLSYDKTVRIWDCKSRKQVACLKGHKAPVTSLDMGPMLAVSGSKDGIGAHVNHMSKQRLSLRP